MSDRELLAAKIFSGGCALFGLGFVLGAFGAHALKPHLSDYGQGIFDLASRYHYLFAISVLLSAVCLKVFPVSERAVRAVSWFFALGFIFFCGSLYSLAITDLRWLGAITPIGGVAGILGWLVLAIAVRRVN